MTEAGRHAFSSAVAVHDQLQSLAREVRSLSGEVAGVVRLFANASAIIGFLPERLKDFQARYPLVQIALTEQISDGVVRACVEDRADVGISSSARCRSSTSSRRTPPSRFPLKEKLDGNTGIDRPRTVSLQ
ncbi:LysR substrate-binding domain-containing protein [Paraburkholderia sp. BR10936]|uniref:LysR substrate-binding domain-containing protein n=1 Tax=Paraburkholderia sp. BR10936 TaxID=3236993 RepID=UPI0034D21BD0